MSGPVIDILYPNLGKKLDSYPQLAGAVEQKMIEEYFNIDLLTGMWAKGVAMVDHIDALKAFVTTDPLDSRRLKEPFTIEFGDLFYRTTIIKNKRPNGLNVFEWKFSNDGFFYSPFLNFKKTERRQRQGLTSDWGIVEAAGLKPFDTLIAGVIDWTKRERKSFNVKALYSHQMMCFEIILDNGDIQWTITFEPGYPEYEPNMASGAVKYSAIQTKNRDDAKLFGDPEKASMPVEKAGRKPVDQPSKKQKL